MPRVSLIDATNTEYRIDTFDWAKVRAWLDEWAPLLAEPAYPLRMQIRALFSWIDGIAEEPDWNADTRFFEWFEVPADPEAIMVRIEQQRKAIELAKAEGRNRVRI